MSLFSRPFRLASWGLTGLLACSSTVQAASGTVEIDLVFPQNDTYAPAPIIPVAFAIQHSDLAAYLQPSLTFSIHPYNNWSHSLADGYYALTWANFSGSDPYMHYGEALNVLNTEGIWMLNWQLDFSHCSGGTGDLNITGESKLGRVIFTTKNRAKKPDLTTATTQQQDTSENTCPNNQAFTFTITSTRDSGDFFENKQPCAVLAETTTPSPTPCAVTIDAAAASSVSSSLTQRACRLQEAGEPTPWCPAPEEDAAGGVVVPGMAVGVVGGVVCLAAAVGGLGFLGAVV